MAEARIRALTCHGCGKPAADETAYAARYGEQRPCVSAAAKPFTCSWCLMTPKPLERVERDRNPRPRIRIAPSTEAPVADPHKQRASEGRFLSPGSLQSNSRRAGGRPRKHRTDRAAHAA